MSESLSMLTIRQMAGTKRKIDMVASDVVKLIDDLRTEIDWDSMTDQDISIYNDSVDALRYSVEALLGKVPIKVRRCKNCGNIFFSSSNSECCNVWDPTGTRCCTVSDMPAPYKTWKCPPRKLNQQEEE